MNTKSATAFLYFYSWTLYQSEIIHGALFFYFFVIILSSFSHKKLIIVVLRLSFDAVSRVVERMAK